MYSYKVFYLLLCIQHVLSKEDSLVKPCAVEDIQCLSQSTEKFLEQTAAGIPAYGLKAIDPFQLPSVDFQNFVESVDLSIKNVTITGFKHLKISGFKMDTKANSVVLAMKADLNIDNYFTLTIPTKSKSYSGTQHIVKATTLGTFQYNYDLKKDDKGVSHFEVGPETVTCECLSSPELHADPESTKILNSDPDIQAISEHYKGDAAIAQKRSYVCELVIPGYRALMHNLRTAATFLPHSAFFTNV